MQFLFSRIRPGWIMKHFGHNQSIICMPAQFFWQEQLRNTGRKNVHKFLHDRRVHRKATTPKPANYKLPSPKQRWKKHVGSKVPSDYTKGLYVLTWSWNSPWKGRVITRWAACLCEGPLYLLTFRLILSLSTYLPLSPYKLTLLSLQTSLLGSFSKLCPL